MSACNDFIYFDRSEEWEPVIGAAFSAKQIVLDQYEPISQVDLGVALDTPYVVIVVQPSDPKPTWRYGGEIRQAWAFSKGSETGSPFATAQSKPTQLFVNKPQIISTPKNSTGKFRLRYHPPTWFRGVLVIGWAYTGTAENFVKDTLFDIGNKVGIGTELDSNNLSNQISSLQGSIELLGAKLTDIQNEAFDDDDVNVIVEDVSLEVNKIVTLNRDTINQQLSTLTNAVNNLLPPEQQIQTDNSTINTFNLDDEIV